MPAKRTLHENAVPTLNLPKTSAVNCNEETSLGINYLSCSSSPNLEETPRHDRFYKRSVKKRAIETFQDISPRKKNVMSLLTQKVREILIPANCCFN